MGHIGGLITGIILGLTYVSILARNNAKRYKYGKIIGILLTIMWFAAGFALFYTVRTPKKNG
jgi:hypothetical protein